MSYGPFVSLFYSIFIDKEKGATEGAF